MHVIRAAAFVKSRVAPTIARAIPGNSAPEIVPSRLDCSCKSFSDSHAVQGVP